MNFNQYVEDVKKYYLKHFSNEQLESANKYFDTEEAQSVIKDGYEWYTSENIDMRGTGKPEAVGYCLSLMW